MSGPLSSSTDSLSSYSSSSSSESSPNIFNDLRQKKGFKDRVKRHFDLFGRPVKATFPIRTSKLQGREVKPLLPSSVKWSIVYMVVLTLGLILLTVAGAHGVDIHGFNVLQFSDKAVKGFAITSAVVGTLTLVYTSAILKVYFNKKKEEEEKKNEESRSPFQSYKSIEDSEKEEEKLEKKQKPKSSSQSLKREKTEEKEIVISDTIAKTEIKDDSGSKTVNLDNPMSEIPKNLINKDFCRLGFGIYKYGIAEHPKFIAKLKSSQITSFPKEFRNWIKNEKDVECYFSIHTDIKSSNDLRTLFPHQLVFSDYNPESPYQKLTDTNLFKYVSCNGVQTVIEVKMGGGIGIKQNTDTKKAIPIDLKKSKKFDLQIHEKENNKKETVLSPDSLYFNVEQTDEGVAWVDIGIKYRGKAALFRLMIITNENAFEAKKLLGALQTEETVGSFLEKVQESEFIFKDQVMEMFAKPDEE